MPLPVSVLYANDEVRARSVFVVRQPSLTNPCLTSEGESKRQPDSWNAFPARYQLNPVALPPPYSASTDFRLLLPYNTCPLQPGKLTPSLVVTEIAPPKVLSPNTGFDPGISAISETVLRSIRSQLTTSPKGWFCRTPST